MGYPPIEQQLRSYGDDAAERERAGTLMSTAVSSRTSATSGSRRSWALVAATVVFILGLATIAITVSRANESPAAARVDPNDRETVAGYIAEASRALDGLRVGDPCPENWADVDASDLKMTPVGAGGPTCRVYAWAPNEVPGLSEQEDRFDQDGTLQVNSSTATTAVQVGSAIIDVRVTPPATVPADTEWHLVIEGGCVSGLPGSDGFREGLPSDACSHSTVAVVRGPGEREVMSAGGIAQLAQLGSMPPVPAGERQSFHLVVASVDGESSYRLPAEGDYEVVGK